MTAVSHNPIRSLALLAAAAVLVAVLGLAACPASAYAYPALTTAGDQVAVYYPKDTTGSANLTYLVSPKGKADFFENVVNLKSSNKNVLEAEVYDDETILITVKKKGIATVSCVYNGKKYSVKYTVKKYVNPVKTLKVGTKNYAAKFKKKNWRKAALSVLKGKLNVVPKANWKLKKVTLTYLDSNANLLTKNVKNGAKVKGILMQLRFKNKNTKAIETITLEAGQADLN